MAGQDIRLLGWYNVKLTAHYSWLLSIVLLAAVPFFMDPELMGQSQVSRLGELLLSFLGLIVYPHLALLENGGIGEVLYAKRVRHSPVFVFRWLLTTVYVLLVLTAFFTLLYLRGADFELWPMIGRITVTAMAIGSGGMAATLLIGNISAGYIAGFAWYLLDFTTKGRFTGHFYLFGQPGGEWDNDKWLLAILSLILAALSAIVLPRRKLE